MKSVETKPQQTSATLLRPPTVSNDLVLSASTNSMESGSRNTEEREMEKERKRVTYVSAGLSAIFTFLFVVVLVSTIGLNWWYALIICGVPAVVGGLLILRRYVKDTERRRLEMEADLAAHRVLFMQYSPLLYDQMQQYALQSCAHCQHCERTQTNHIASQTDASATDPTSPTTCCETNNKPPDYDALFPKEESTNPGNT